VSKLKLENSGLGFILVTGNANLPSLLTLAHIIWPGFRARVSADSSCPVFVHRFLAGSSCPVLKKSKTTALIGIEPISLLNPDSARTTRFLAD
jgi:hypothetical protein